MTVTVESAEQTAQINFSHLTIKEKQTMPNMRLDKNPMPEQCPNVRKTPAFGAYFEFLSKIFVKYLL